MSDGTDEDDTSKNRSGPGGGPKKVVSSRSVDDILESIKETPTEQSQPSRADEAVADRVDAVDGDDSVESAESDASNESLEPDKSDETENVDSGGPDESDDSSAISPDSSVSDDVETTDEDTADHETTDEDTVDHETTTPETTSLEHRIESGSVTGADVRAAEAGEGREQTPDVDEIDLSLDDLEGATATEPVDVEAATETGSDDAGPLAGSIPRGSEAESATTERDDEQPTESTSDSSSSGGLMGWLRGLFSR